MAVFSVPVVLGVAAASAVFAGGKRAYDGYQKGEDAKSIREQADKKLEESQKKLEQNRAKTSAKLERLGEEKARLVKEEISDAVNLFSKVQYLDFPCVSDPRREECLLDSDEHLMRVQTTASATHSVLQEIGTGVAGSTGGALVFLGAYGTLASNGVAYTSIGAATSGISAGASQGATLAWLGGAWATTGGYGLAVLGGVVAGPALLFGGLFYSWRADEKLADAKEYLAESKKYAQQARKGIDHLLQLSELVSLIEKVIYRIKGMLREQIGRARDVIRNNLNDESGFVDGGTLKESEKDCLIALFYLSTLAHSAIEIDLLDSEGAVKSGVWEDIKTIEDSI